MHDDQWSFFAQLDAATRHDLLDHFTRTRFPAGSALTLQGEIPGALHVIDAGVAEVLVTVQDGRQERVSRVGPGATLGEMSLLTGQPASATVRALIDVEAYTISAEDFSRLAGATPDLYRVMGQVLAARLAQANQRVARGTRGRAFLLVDHGAPPLLGFALACSVAFHTQGSVLHVILGDQAPAEVQALAHGPAAAQAYRRGEPGRAHLVVAKPAGLYAPEALNGTIEDLCDGYDIVLVQVPPQCARTLSGLKRVRLAGHGLEDLKPDEDALCVVIGWVNGSRGLGARAETAVHVPQPQALEEQALASGVLPASGAAGRELGWAARRMCGLMVGVALGSGSARGYAHFGVLGVLAKAGVPIDYLAGTSIGAVVCALYGLGLSLEDAANAMDRVGPLAFRPTLPVSAVMSNVALRGGLREIAGSRRIEHLSPQIGIVSADIQSGCEVVFRRGLVWPAVLASISIPGVLPPQRIGPYTLVDGGAVNPVPANVVAEMGADIVIAVRLSTPIAPAVQAVARTPQRGAPPMLQTLMRSLELVQSRIAEPVSTVQIAPIVRDDAQIGLRNFAKGRQYQRLGAAAAESAMPRIAAVLPWLRRPPD